MKCYELRVLSFFNKRNRKTKSDLLPCRCKLVYLKDLSPQNFITLTRSNFHFQYCKYIGKGWIIEFVLRCKFSISQLIQIFQFWETFCNTWNFSNSYFCAPRVYHWLDDAAIGPIENANLYWSWITWETSKSKFSNFWCVFFC